MKKKLISIFFIMLLALPAFSQNADENSKPLEVGISFDWVSKTQLQRDENISQIKNVLFNEKTITYSKKQFKEKYKDFLKNKNYMTDYDEISNGKKEDTDKYYCGFYWNKLLVAYGIQYKKNMKSIYYYDALGNLRWVDAFSDGYPNFPYWSYQYGTDGKIVAAYYYISDNDQYVFDSSKKFKGVWHYEKMYNKNAKVIMTRTNW